MMVLHHFVCGVSLRILPLFMFLGKPNYHLIFTPCIMSHGHVRLFNQVIVLTNILNPAFTLLLYDTTEMFTCLYLKSSKNYRGYQNTVGAPKESVEGKSIS